MVPIFRNIDTELGVLKVSEFRLGMSRVERQQKENSQAESFHFAPQNS
jgi:hypothetical protein